MMTILTEFLAAMLVTSALLYGIARLYQWIVPRIEQWPGLWSLTLGLTVLIPVLGIALSFVPGEFSAKARELLVPHLPLDPVTWPSAIDVSAQGPLASSPLGQVLTGLLSVYVFGVCGFALKLAMGRFRLRNIVRSAAPLGRLDGANILISSRIRSPFAYTPFGRPDASCILIPRRFARQMDGLQINHIITHERAHIMRRDDEMGLILRALLCLCWISPFAHGLFARWSQATEIQCDRAVTQGRSPQMRRDYADTLLQALHIVAGRVRQYPAASFSTHRLRNEKMRITHIVNASAFAFKRSRDRMMLAFAAACVTALGTLSIASTASARGDQVQTTDRETSPPAQAPVAVSQTPANEIVSGKLTARFGKAHDPFKTGSAVIHRGVDIAAPFGTPIYAPANGTIRVATNVYDGKPGYGNVVVIQTDGGVMTMFAHLQGYTVEEGQTVAKGEQIAMVGSSGKSTGPHVHIETQKDGALVDPMDVWDLGAG